MNQKLVGLVLSAVLGLMTASSRGADVVIEWNLALLDAIRADQSPPPLAARNMAIVHVAMFDALVSIQKTHVPYAVEYTAPAGAAPKAAMAAAAHRTLSVLYPDSRASFNRLLTRSLRGISQTRATRGVRTGNFVANRILRLRANDGSGAEVPYEVSPGPGIWRPTPPGFASALLPQWPFVTPFAMVVGFQFRPAGPPALNSEDYLGSFEEVTSLGAIDSATRTAEQTEIALFWADGPGTATPPGHWNEIAQSLALSNGNTTAQNARLFALLNIALADAAIVAWDAKYTYNVWRPVTGIREADTDGNPDTDADPDWTPLINTPPFPAYTSGHSTFSASAAVVLANFFGTDEQSFSTTSDALPGVIRHYDNLLDAAAEAGQSRIYGGIHWQFDNIDGLESGGALGQYVADNFLLPAVQPN